MGRNNDIEVLTTEIKREVYGSVDKYMMRSEENINELHRQKKEFEKEIEKLKKEIAIKDKLLSEYRKDK